MEEQAIENDSDWLKEEKWITNLEGKCPNCQSRRYKPIPGEELDKRCIECGNAYK